MSDFVVEFDSNNRAEISDNGKNVFIMWRGLHARNWKIITVLSRREMDGLCAAWSEFKHKAPGVKGDTPGANPAVVDQSGVK